MNSLDLLVFLLISIKNIIIFYIFIIIFYILEIYECKQSLLLLKMELIKSSPTRVLEKIRQAGVYKRR
jgi:hypothetical protein